MGYFLFLPLLLVCIVTYSQTDKHTNTNGSEIIVDAPYRLERFDGFGNLNALPLHVFIHGSSCISCNNELMNILVKVKSASDTEFNDTILFDNLPDEDFNALFVNKSETDTDFGIQSFDESLPIKSNVYTIDFTSHEHLFPFTTYTDITQDYWWFTILIPAEKFDFYGDIIDLEVYCELDWDPDYVCRLRVFRQDEPYPAIDGWLRGDTHFHSLYTQNSAELGVPLDATKIMAQICGLDWITITDHSCDFDNYGLNMYDNWQRLRNEIVSHNSEPDSFLFIHAIEMSVRNAADDNVHALVYPSPTNPFSLPYLGDGDGDISATDVTIERLIDSLQLYGAFSYMAHPFAQGDALSFIVDGSVWNLSDAEFTENDGAHEFFGTVVCNDLEEESDVFCADPNFLIKPGFLGGQIWNLYSNLKCDEADNPWDVLYDSGDGFYYFPWDDELNTTNRFMQNLEVTEFIWKKALQQKNLNPDLQNWKYFIEAGSDAHGAFNFSNTDLFMGLSGQVTDNSIGRLSSLVYCPDGAGASGENILNAMKNGNLILSSGPVIGFGIDTDNSNSIDEIILGNDTILDYNVFEEATLNIFAANTDEFGEIIRKNLIVTTEIGEYIADLPLNTSDFEVNLPEFLNNTGFTDFTGQWFMIRAEMQTRRYYMQPEIYHCDSTDFYCYTNPVWLKVGEPNEIVSNISTTEIDFYPNPADDFISLKNNESGLLEIYNLSGGLIYSKLFSANQTIDISAIEQGSYFVFLKTKSCNQISKLVVLR